jgi:ZIP family zinc transporter
MSEILLYVLAATGAGLVGGLVGFFWAPSIEVRSAIQHFAAGVVIAAVASDVIPEVERVGTPAGILGGFAAGGVVMIGMKWLVLRFEKREARRGRFPVGLSVAAGFDTLADGAIISTGFSTAREVGVLLAIALAIELAFLTLSVGSEFRKTRKEKKWHGPAVTTAIALMLPLGAVAGGWALKDVSPTTVAACMAFGAAALIYLIAEELLVESFQAEESLLSTATLFAGFLVVLALKLTHHH